MHHHNHGIGFQYDHSERRKHLSPEDLLQRIGLKEGMTFVDVGCNDGFFAIPAAKIVGTSGKVYGVDVDAEAIRRLEATAAEEGLTNITTRVGTAEETLFCEGCADIVFFGIVLHDFKDPAQVLGNAHAMLAPDGVLANLDWKKEQPTEAGPPPSVRLSTKEAAALMEKAGFTVRDTSDFSPELYLMTALRA